MTNALPREARLKLADLTKQADEAAALARLAKDRLSKLDDDLHTTEDPEVFANIEVEMTRQRAVLVGHQNRHRELANLATKIATFVRGHDGRLVAAPPIKLKSDASVDALVADIAATRERIKEARQQHRAINHAPPPKSVLIEMAKKHVADLAARGKPQVMASGTGGVQISFSGEGNWIGVTGERVFAMLAWSNPDGVTARILEQIDAMPESAHGLPPVERQKRLDALTAEIDELERREEALIVAAIERGQQVWRRSDVSPQCVLGVRIGNARVVRVGGNTRVARFGDARGRLDAAE